MRDTHCKSEHTTYRDTHTERDTMGDAKQRHCERHTETHTERDTHTKASYLPSMVLGKVEGEVDGQEQQKNWSLWKLEWLQTWTEGQASRLFPLPYVLYRKYRPFAWVR